MRVLSLNDDNVVIGVKEVLENYVMNNNEIQSFTGELGQVYQADGTFLTPEPTPGEPVTTIEDKINYIYYKQMGVIV